MTAAPVGNLRSPFPYFGGKSRAASEVWSRFGNPANYVEPFAGSLAILLARPNIHAWWDRNESVNDTDANLSNWFRAVTADPEAVAHHAAQPVNEADLTARHLWLVQNGPDLKARLMSDPEAYDARAAGWWVYGISCWVGGDWCTGIGPHTGSTEPSISNGGTSPGVYRKIPMMAGSHGGKGIHRPRPVRHQRTVPDIRGGIEQALADEFATLANRLRRVRVACGNWDRLLGQVIEPPNGHYTAVLLDPPYDLTERRGDLYALGDRPTDRATSVHEQARTWAIQHGADPAMRIAYCSYSTDEEDSLFTEAGWSAHRWSAQGGYGLASENRAKSNRDREVIWFSPTCPAPVEETQPSLFEDLP